MWRDKTLGEEEDKTRCKCDKPTYHPPSSDKFNTCVKCGLELVNGVHYTSGGSWSIRKGKPPTKMTDAPIRPGMYGGG